MADQVLYHGSSEEYDELESGNPGYSGSLGYGLYLTPDPEFAAVFGKYIHEVRNPVPDELVADLSADMWTYDCGDSLVLGTPGAVPFTFELLDRKTGKTERYSVLENCDYAVKQQLRDMYIEEGDYKQGPAGEATSYEGLSAEQTRYAISLWDEALRRMQEDPEESAEDAVEGAIETAGDDWEEVPEWAEAVEDRMTDAASDFDAALTKATDQQLGTEINLDEISNEVAAAGYSAFYLDGYSPGAGEFVIIDETYLPLKVERVTLARR